MITVCNAKSSDLKGIVIVHMKAFKGFFLTQLGEKFLIELYKGFIQEKSGICLIAKESEEIIGFLAGTLNPQVFFKRLLRRRWYAFISASILSIFQSPFFIIKKLVSAITYRGEQPPHCMEAALISSFAVAPDFSNRGIGKMLINSFCDSVKYAKVPYVYLITDRDDNEKVNKFYRGLGFELESSFLKQGNRWMNRYIKRINN